MARPLRIEFAGAVYHVTSRGNARQDIVRDDLDREKWVDWLRRTVETYNWRLHAWVLMTNHLFVETPEANLSAGMQYFGGSYTSYFNRRRYARFVRAGVEQPPPSPFEQALAGVLVGSDAFFGRVRRLLDEKPTDRGVPQLDHLRGRPTVEAIKEAVGAHFGVDTSRWTPGHREDDASRAVAAYLARRRFGHPAGKVADALGYRIPSSVTRAVARVESGNDELNRTATRLESTLN